MGWSGFIQLLMETGAETHRQTNIGGAQESCGRGEGLRELEGSREPQEDPQSQLSWAHGGSQRLNHQPKRMHGLDLSPLYICSRYAAWSSCGSPNNWSRGCLWLCCLPLDLLPLAELPGLAAVGEDAMSPDETRLPGQVGTGV